MEVDKKFNNISIFNFNESWVNVKFNDPSSKNALSENMINELNNFLDQIEGSDKIRGISFKGSNGMFCSGANLKEIN
jgi:isohexenylglutaconyl-CoA hydratase